MGASESGQPPELFGENIKVSVSFLDGETKELGPVVYKAVTDGTAKMQTITDQCGHSETEQLSSGNVAKTIDALLFKEQVNKLYTAYNNGDQVDVTLPAEAGEITLILQDITIKETNDRNKFVTPDGREAKVFDTQIQLKAPGREE